MWWEIPRSLEVRNHELFIGGLRSKDLAEKYGTPLYITDGSRIEENYNRLFRSIQQYLKRKLVVHYSIKANSNMAILNLLRRRGSSVDATSPFEVQIAIKVGFTRDQIICTGTSFSDNDMIAVADKCIMNIDSMSQLKRFAHLVKTKGFNNTVSIRVNPGKGVGHCPECITAGEDAKYGIPEQEAFLAFEKALEYGLKPIGIHQHLGSGILSPDLEVFYQSENKLLDLAVKIKNKLKIDLKFIDFGGGLGIPYTASDTAIDIKVFGERFSQIIETSSLQHRLGDFDVYLEPGRFIVGDSTVLLMKVVDVNQKYLNELGVDAGFNVFDRPARYKTYHEIVNVSKADVTPTQLYRVSGNLCESGDVFTENKHALRKLPVSEEGDYLAILNTGAYGSSMSSNYNMRPRAREIMIYDGKIKIMRKRDDFEDIIRNQRK